MTTTPKNITLAPSIDAVAFTFTPEAYEAADAWHRAGKANIKASVAFYDMLIGKGVDPVTLRKPDGRAFTNMEAAAFDFTLRLYFRVKLGAACATAIFDETVPKETILKPTGLTASGTVITPQPKKNLRSSYGASDQWGKFVAELIAMKNARAAQQAADEAAAAGIEVPVPTKAKPVGKSDKTYTVDNIGAVIKRLSKDVEKHDGSAPSDNMKKFAAYLADGLKTYGFN